MKRFLAAVVMVFSSLGFLIGWVGMIGVWVVNTPATDRLTGALDKAEMVLVFSHDRLDLSVTQLTETQVMLATVKETVSAAGENLSENSPTLAYLSDTFGAELKPKVETAAEIVTTIRGTIISVNDTLEAANSIPFVSVPSLPMEELSAIDQQMQAAVTSMKSLGDTIRDVESGIVDRAKTAVIVPMDQLTVLVDQVLKPLETFAATLERVKTEVRNANTRIPSLIDWGSALVTLFSFWFILAQVSLFYGGWYFWKTGTLPTIENPS